MQLLLRLLPERQLPYLKKLVFELVAERINKALDTDTYISSCIKSPAGLRIQAEARLSVAGSIVDIIIHFFPKCKGFFREKFEFYAKNCRFRARRVLSRDEYSIDKTNSM